jgi:hypothetical protein
MSRTIPRHDPNPPALAEVPFGALFTEGAFYVVSRCLPLDYQQPRQKDPLAWQEMRERCSFRFCDLSLIAAQFKMRLDGGICNDTEEQ